MLLGVKFGIYASVCSAVVVCYCASGCGVRNVRSYFVSVAFVCCCASGGEVPNIRFYRFIGFVRLFVVEAMDVKFGTFASSC